MKWKRCGNIIYVYLMKIYDLYAVKIERSPDAFITYKQVWKIL